jgi:hypothetical protein
MAIIKPSLVFEGSHLGNRFDPDPGDYTARLVDVEFTNEGKSQVRMHWELTSHPPTGYSWRARHTCTLAQEYIGFLNKHLWCWKRKGWADLGEDDTERLDTLRLGLGMRPMFVSSLGILKIPVRLPSPRRLVFGHELATFLGR